MNWFWDDQKYNIHKLFLVAGWSFETPFHVIIMKWTPAYIKPSDYLATLSRSKMVANDTRLSIKL